MAPQQTDTITAGPAKYAKPVELGSAYVVPDVTEVTVEPTDPALPICHMRIEMQEGDSPICTEVRLESRPGCAPITSTTLRGLKLDPWMRVALEIVVTTNDGSWAVVAEGGAERFHDRYEGQLKPRRGSRRPDYLVREVADHYREARRLFRNPQQQVMDRFGMTRNTADRYIADAEARGYDIGGPRPRSRKRR